MNTHKKYCDAPYLGFGIGLRSEHYNDFLRTSPQVDWLEIISETFLTGVGKHNEVLENLIEKYPIVPHGVSLSIGSVDPVDKTYLKQLKNLVEKTKAPWFSDHLSWSKINHHNLHNLMPLPQTKKTALFVADKIKEVQDYIGKPFIFENVSSYMEFTASNLPEWEFIRLIAETADCGILLDINNVFVSAYNHSFDPMDFLNGIPAERVLQYHIAGHLDKGTYILDTHDHDIRQEVWDLYQKVIPMFGEVSLMLERDDNIPPLNELLEELNQAKTLHQAVSLELQPHG